MESADSPEIRLSKNKYYDAHFSHWIKTMTQGTLLPLFKEQLENQAAKLGELHELPKRGDHLIWWYFQEIEGFSQDEIEEVYCDGSADLGIDAEWIDEDDVIHIYLFKHPEDPKKAFPSSGVDALIAGLAVIFNDEHSKVSNEKLKGRIEAIRQVMPKAYRVHLVTSGIGIGLEQTTKLDTFVAGIPSPTDDFFQWTLEDLVKLQERFYLQNLPAVADPIVFVLDKPPYLMESGSAGCYLFATDAHTLANLYGTHGESLLHRNIRASQGDTPANRAVYATCTGDKSADFIHFNNGISILADDVHWNPMQNKMTLTRSQIVNGGQTIRILHKASRDGSLRSDVRVAVRVIKSGDNNQFGSDVTVNQNNQNSMQTGFLRSNDPCVVQLATSLASQGWYLERRKGELKSLSPEEKQRIERKLNHPLAGRVIKLKEGTQAYVATYFKHPELAKKNPKKMFQGAEEGGYFDRIYSNLISAEKVISANRIVAAVETFVHKFDLMRNRKRRRGEDQTWLLEYAELLGEPLFLDCAMQLSQLDQMVPQSAMFLSATIFQEWVEVLGMDPSKLADHIETESATVICEHIGMIMEYARTKPDAVDGSWPTLMKSNKFLNSVMAFIAGKRSQKPTHA